MAEIKIDSKLFQERVSHFINSWKADKRSGDALFGGASSIVINMGKAEEVPEFHKNNAVHVSYCAALITSGPLGTSHANPCFQFWLLGYEFPTTLMLFTLDTIYIITTQKKGARIHLSITRCWC